MLSPGEGITERSDDGSGANGSEPLVLPEDTIYSKDPEKQSYRCLWISQWIARLILFFIVLSSLVASHISFVKMSLLFNSSDINSSHINSSGMIESRDDGAADGVFWLLLLSVLIPYGFNFLRCFWYGLLLFSKDKDKYPLPTCKWFWSGLGTSLIESAALAVFVVWAQYIAHLALTISLSSGVCFWTMFCKIFQWIFQWCRARCCPSGETGDETKPFANGITRLGSIQGGPGPQKDSSVCPIIFAVATFICEIPGLSLTFFVAAQNRPQHQIWELHWMPVLAVVALSVAWLPSLQKGIANMTEKGIANMTEKRSHKLTAGTRWKAGIINGISRLILTPLFAVLFFCLKSGGARAVSNSWTAFVHMPSDSNYLVSFYINVSTSLLAYIFSLIAFSTKMHKAGFFFPILFSSPLSAVYLFTYGEFSTIATASNPFAISATVLLLLGQFLFYLVVFSKRAKSTALVREEEVFIHSYYNGPFVEQCLMLNLLTKDSSSTKNMRPGIKNSETKVFICSTMFQESRAEQKKLIESLISVKDGHKRQRKKEEIIRELKNKKKAEKSRCNLNCMRKEKKKTPPQNEKEQQTSFCNFEFHIFFDGGVSESTLSSYALSLEKLLNEMLKDKTRTSFSTAYGMQMRWYLGENFPLYVHFKDSKKFRKGKRWSQVMYMSNIIDHCRQNQKDLENTFVLTTDADVGFTYEAVRIICDRLTRDNRVGAVCGRIHPTGSGPVVWYQKFEYAIGHWLQKASEHVLGSVMCSPGCFSVFRAEALKEVLNDYRTDVNVKEPLEFLKKDMGEDRWLSTLLMSKGWRLDYAAAADCRTVCPDNFNEFFKKRRRWISSTLANLCEVISQAREIMSINEATSLFFLAYQAVVLFATIISPATVILVMATGLQYSFPSTPDNLFIAFIAIFLLLSAFFGLVNICCSANTTQLVAKGLAFIFTLAMAVVVIGVVKQFAKGLDFKNENPTEIPMTSSPHDVTPTANNYSFVPLENEFLNTSIVSNSLKIVNDLGQVPISSWYLGALVAVFLMAACIHPMEALDIFSGVFYLFALPTGFILLIIYAVCNLNDQKWGTRDKGEAKDGSENNDTIPPKCEEFWQGMVDVFGCCVLCQMKRSKKNKEGDPNTNPNQNPNPLNPNTNTNPLNHTTTPTPTEEGDQKSSMENKEVDKQSSNKRELHNLPNLEHSEHTFWQNLKTRRRSISYELTDEARAEMEKKLLELRNYWILIFSVTNLVWITLVIFLELHPALNVRGTNVLGLSFLLVYGVVFGIQLLACIWHRVETLIHYLSSRPYVEPWGCCCKSCYAFCCADCFKHCYPCYNLEDVEADNTRKS